MPVCSECYSQANGPEEFRYENLKLKDGTKVGHWACKGCVCQHRKDAKKVIDGKVS